MARRSRKERRVVSEMNVVPYIDVMLVLLVIFMVTAPLLTQGVEVDLPATKASTIQQDEAIPFVVSVDKEGQFFFNGALDPLKPLEAEQLALSVAAQKKLHPERPVFVKGDQLVGYGKVVEVMALIKQAGVEKVGLLTQPGHEQNS